MAADPRHVRAALWSMETHLQSLAQSAEQQLYDADRMAQQMTAALDEAMAGLSRLLDRAEDDLAYCRSLVDDEGRRPDCSRYYRRCQEIRGAISRTAALRQQFEKATGRYQNDAAALREAIGRDIPAVNHWLRDRERALERFEAGRVGVQHGSAAIASGSPAMLSAFNAAFEGMDAHGYKYQKARQAYLRSLADDASQPKYVRGWIKQELNRIDRAGRARAAGQRPPGGSARNLRGIPGLDLPENFRLDDVWVNRHRPSTAKRLDVDHLYR